MIPFRRTLIAATATACLALSTGLALAADSTIKIASIQELSGGGATVGNNFKNGMDLAIREINAAGGSAIVNGDNVADWVGAQRLIEAAVEAFGDLHILALVYLAGNDDYGEPF